MPAAGSDSRPRRQTEYNTIRTGIANRIPRKKATYPSSIVHNFAAKPHWPAEEPCVRLYDPNTLIVRNRMGMSLTPLQNEGAAFHESLNSWWATTRSYPGELPEGRVVTRSSANRCRRQSSSFTMLSRSPAVRRRAAGAPTSTFHSSNRFTVITENTCRRSPPLSTNSQITDATPLSCFILRTLILWPVRYHLITGANFARSSVEAPICRSTLCSPSKSSALASLSMCSTALTGVASGFGTVAAVRVVGCLDGCVVEACVDACVDAVVEPAAETLAPITTTQHDSNAVKPCRLSITLSSRQNSYPSKTRPQPASHCKRPCSAPCASSRPAAPRARDTHPPPAT